MGFMDKVKTAAQDVAREAKKATSQASDKLGEAQARKRMDDAAKRLGHLIYAERRKGQAPGAEADALLDEMAAHEKAVEEARAAAAQAAAQAPAGSAPEAATDDPSATHTAPPDAATAAGSDAATTGADDDLAPPAPPAPEASEGPPEGPER